MAKDIEDIFLKAAEIVKKLPKNVQETAFNRAVEELKKKQSETGRIIKKEVIREKNSSSATNDIIDKIDRTKYPDMGETSRTADWALKVLQLAAEDYDTDGLTAAQIASILTLKFRLPVTANAINTALDRETKTVDVKKSIQGKIFRIMAPGEDYLHQLRSKNK